MKKYLLLIITLIFVLYNCDKDDYAIPTDENGNIIWTGVSSSTTTGISSLDNSFTVEATFATAKPGDVMKVELLQLQTPPGGGTTNQLLPLEGTQKEVQVDNNLKSTVTYTRDQANLSKVGDYIEVVFNGATDYAKMRVTMTNGMSVSAPKVRTGDKDLEVEVARTAEVAYFFVNVTPKEVAFNGEVEVTRKNGTNGSWVDVMGSPYSGADQPYYVPISGNDFILTNDTMFYKFTATQGSYTETIEKTIIVRDPYFFLKKSATLMLGTSSAGRNMLTNTPVPADDATAMIAVYESLLLRGGSDWLADGNKIEFVPTTTAMYALNNSNTTIEAFETGTPVLSVDPITGDGVFIFKATTGTAPENVYYGMIMVTNVIPNASVTFEYRIGNMYAHLAVIK